MRSITKSNEIVLSALGAVLIAVSSWICIPTAVPFTLQTFAIGCILVIFGGRVGAKSIGIYVLLGVIGIPVFAGFKGGLGVIFGPTGGFVVGFILMALIYWLVENRWGNRTKTQVISFALGYILCYLFGSLWFIYFYGSDVGVTDMGQAISICVAPFILTDIVKTIMAIIVGNTVKKRIDKERPLK